MLLGGEEGDVPSSCWWNVDCYCSVQSIHVRYNLGKGLNQPEKAWNTKVDVSDEAPQVQAGKIEALQPALVKDVLL